MWFVEIVVFEWRGSSGKQRRSTEKQSIGFAWKTGEIEKRERDSGKQRKNFEWETNKIERERW